MPIAKFRVNMDLWPIAVLRWQGELGDGDYEKLIEVLEPVYKRGTSFILISDARAMTQGPNAAQRRFISVRTEKLQIKYGFRPYGSIVIADSVLVRRALTALQWLFHREVFVVADMDEALAKATEILLHAGVVLPPGLSSPS